jgi:hypothetical protein
MDWRYFDSNQDQDAAERLWHEVGWLNRADPQACKGMAIYTSATKGYAGLVHGAPECFVFTAPATFQYLGEELSLCGVTGVATSRNGRKQGLALGLAARAVAEAARDGVALAGLSTFEQGFYDRIGFGNAAYEHLWRFDPVRLTVSDQVRAPHHLHPSDFEAIHDARLARKRFHGSVSVLDPRITQSAMLRTPGGFGLGYFDGPSETPSHGLWCSVQQMMSGPYIVEFLFWQTSAQLRELLGLIKQWGDQVRQVNLAEPSGVQLQDLMDRPTQHFNSTAGGNFPSGCQGRAWFQYRVLDLAACIAATRLTGPEVAFNLELSDPLGAYIERFPTLFEDIEWRGIAGTYRVSFGRKSHVEAGFDGSLPTLKAPVGAFTRLWLGVRPATGLAVTDDLSGPPELLAQLDESLRLPSPVTDWQF